MGRTGMRELARAGLLALGAALIPGVGQAGVPGSCVHPDYDPIECIRETRLERRDVLPSARVRELEAQQAELAGQAPRQDLERNELLREIRELLDPGREP